MERNNVNNNLNANVITTGLNNLDKMIGGFHGGDLVFLGGRPITGKTALALNIVNNIAMGNNLPCLYISAEGTKETQKKKLSRIGGDETFEILYNIDGRSNQLFYFEDQPSDIDTFEKLAETIKRYKEKHNIQFVVMDYLHLFMPRREQERQQYIVKLKELAVELNITIMLLFHTGRGIEYRNGRMPKLKDFDECAHIREMPDILMILTRNGYYDGLIKEDSPYDAELTVLKTPRGVTGCAKLTWLPNKLWFLDRTETAANNNISFNPEKSSGIELADEILGIPQNKDENSESEHDVKIKEKLIAVLTETLNSFSDIEKKIIVSLYGLDGEKKTYPEVAQINGMTEDQVREAETSALRKLRHPLLSRKLKNVMTSDAEDDFS